MKKLLDFRVNKIAYFENCFLLAVDRKPIDFIIDKVKAGSDFDMGEYMHFMATAPDIRRVGLPVPEDAPSWFQKAFNVSLSPIKPAEGWTIALPEGAKETNILFSKGLIRRSALVLKNELLHW